MPGLFAPITLRDTTIRNRVWLSPMCQYACDEMDGVPHDWHLVHLGARATGGFGLVLTEATAVSAEGRISPQDTGLWNDAQVAAWSRITAFVKGQGATVGVQLAHAGRKGSTAAPWRGTGTIPMSAGGWEPVGPSPVPFGDYVAPAELSADAVAAVVRGFAQATRRADEAGFEVVEIHAAHGYLLHQFLSPLANRRTDRYGGSFDNRVRLTLEVVDAVRAAWGEDRPLLVRLSATDWVQGGWTPADSCALAVRLAEHGVDLVDVSSAGLHADQKITVGPGYQVPFAADVRAKSGLPTGAVGLITEPGQAQQILDAEQADVVLLARAALREPAWPWRAAHELGLPTEASPYPPNYTRGAWR